jgi:hypothetical protein
MQNIVSLHFDHLFDEYRQTFSLAQDMSRREMNRSEKERKNNHLIMNGDDERSMQEEWHDETRQERKKERKT